MKALLFASLLAVAAVTVASPAEAGIFRRRVPNNGPAPVMPAPVPHRQPLVEERITNLPEDGGMCYFTVFTSANPEANPKERQLLETLRTNPTLLKITSQCHFHHIQADNPLFAGRYQPYVGNIMPAVVLQEPRGDHNVFFRRTGSSVPDDGDELAEAIVESIRERFSPPTRLANQAPPLQPAVQPVVHTASQAAPQVQPAVAAAAAARPFHRPKPEPSPCPNPNVAPPQNPNVNVVVAPPDIGAIEEDEESTSDYTLGLAAAAFVTV
ncbi:MAG: hypothetical protein JNG90_05325, partial [Planctomycetaceae bacterium]|nr:hypothetical protein [Planctomycetaceae bacterium]